MIDSRVLLDALGCDPTVGDLAALWPIRPDRLAMAVRAAAGVALDDLETLAVWVRLDEQLAEAELRRLDVEEHPAIIDVALAAAITPAPGLHIDDELAGRLPLLTLARDLAGRSPCRRLAVERRPAEDIGARGYFTRSSLAAVIVLADDLAGEALAETFAHEVGHGLDPEFADVDGPGLEMFADALAPRLLEVEPSTVAEAAFLVARTLRETAGARRSRPTAGSVAALVEWALVDAGVLDPELELVAACRSRARDVVPPRSKGGEGGTRLSVSRTPACVPGPESSIHGESPEA